MTKQVGLLRCLPMEEAGIADQAFTLFGDLEKGEIEVDCKYMVPGDEVYTCELNGDNCQFPMPQRSRIVAKNEVRSLTGLSSLTFATRLISNHLPLLLVASWFVLLNFLDVITTYYGINSGALMESNPLFPILTLKGLAVYYKFVIVMASLFIIFQTYRYNERLYIWVTAFLMGAVHAVVLSNIYLILL